MTPEGSFTPQGADVVEVPAEGVASVDLTEALAFARLHLAAAAPSLEEK